MEELISILEEIREDIDFADTTDLIDGGILDSFDILQIISALNEAYDISIPAAEIIPANFNSAEALLAMVERLSEE
ncbi:MAG: phosphopantetheine-binding protein [Suilimivivens sp.]|nr:acyl carrier protein [Lachnospiraceae bacterium]MDY5870608.1 phosphopantetheine-binding protein [Lachnospiraceae bacterium]